MSDNDLFGVIHRKKLDKESENFINCVHSLPEDLIRLIIENTWLCFGELQSRITIYLFGGKTLTYICPSVLAHKILCAL